MRKQLTCPQCGAAITDEKCPYCGAVFYDFSTITLQEPCYIRIKAKAGDENFLITARVLPLEMNVTVRPIYIEAKEWYGVIVSPQRISHEEGEIEMKFQMLTDMNSKTGGLYRIEKTGT